MANKLHHLTFSQYAIHVACYVGMSKKEKNVEVKGYIIGIANELEDYCFKRAGRTKEGFFENKYYLNKILRMKKKVEDDYRTEIDKDMHDKAIDYLNEMKDYVKNYHE